MQSSCLELEEIRRFEGKRMQSSCLELKERRRVEGTRKPSSFLKKLGKKSLGNKDAEQLHRVRI